MEKGKIINTTIIIVLVVWLIVAMGSMFSGNSLNEFWCDNALASYNSYDGTSTCYYPECNSQASYIVQTDSLYDGIEDVDEARKLLAKMENKAGLISGADSFNYTEKIKQTYTEKGTYLVPQSDGSFKLENRKNDYEYYVNGDTKHVSFSQYSGCYCDEHYLIAQSTWNQEVKETFITKNFSYQFSQFNSKYGIWIWWAAFTTYLIVGYVIRTKAAQKAEE